MKTEQTPETPRTDAAWTAAFRSTSIDAESIRDFAQILEREGNAASAEIEAMREAIKEAYATISSLRVAAPHPHPQEHPSLFRASQKADAALAKLQPFINHDLRHTTH